jgi:hypothetical protein
MTIAEAHIEFEITLDKRSTSQAPEMPAEVIDYFLNEAQARYVKTRYNRNNIYQAGFEEMQKRTEDLRSLVVTDTLPVEDVPYEESGKYYQVVLSETTNQYWFYIRGRAQVTKENCGTIFSRVKVIQQDDLEKVLDDPFNKPSYSYPIIYFENDNIIVVGDGSFTVDGFKLTYIKEPARVNDGTYGQPVVEFDLPEHTHKEVVQLAADIAIENIESQRIQTIKQQIATME